MLIAKVTFIKNVNSKSNFYKNVKSKSNFYKMLIAKVTLTELEPENTSRIRDFGTDIFLIVCFHVRAEF